jgi:flagellar biosynthesis protein FlhF
MDVRTYRAKSMPEALAMVRRDLGPDAAVLHTSQSGRGMLGWLRGGPRIEVTASASVNVPSRLPEKLRCPAPPARGISPTPEFPSPSEIPTPPETLLSQEAPPRLPPADGQDFRSTFRNSLETQGGEPYSLVEEYSLSTRRMGHELSETLFGLYTDLIEAEVGEDMAQELVERVRCESGGLDADSPALWKSRIARMIEEDIETCGPIVVTPGKSRLVALVGPTGVGKTTTIAKLAANYRLREKRRVGLITVDTYRIAAVDQLRTYADIIDLPMEVVATPREMREAVARLSGLDLILMDTAGRSPRDEVKIQELKSVLAEAGADEVHLVLSCVAGSQALVKTAERFADVGTTALLLTKLDEAPALGNMLPLLKNAGLPLSYVTNGQNVPDDIEAASRGQIARAILGMES